MEIDGNVVSAVQSHTMRFQTHVICLDIIYTEIILLYMVHNVIKINMDPQTSQTAIKCLRSLTEMRLNLFIYLCIYLFVCLSIHPSIHLFIQLISVATQVNQVILGSLHF